MGSEGRLTILWRALARQIQRACNIASLPPVAARRYARIRKGRPLRIRPGRNLEVVVTTGCAWITVDGLRSDIVLTAGERQTFGKKDDLIISGCPVCGVHVMADLDFYPEKLRQGLEYGNWIDLATADGIATISLNRPNALNALSSEFIRELDALIDFAEGDESVRVIVIQSKGRHFSAGADVREMLATTSSIARATDYAGSSNRLSSTKKPIVVAVNGIVAGGGCELVEMADIVIAADTAKFCHPELRLGAMPGAGGTLRLTRSVGKHVAMDMLITGRMLDATEAMAFGLASRLVPEAELHAEATRLASEIAALPGPVMQRIKKSVRAVAEPTRQLLLDERKAFHQCFDESDFREGLSSFLEKRPPRFGRA